MIGDNVTNELNHNIINLFPVSIHQIDVNGFDKVKDELINYAYDLQKRDPVGRRISNRGGWQSPTFQVNNKDDVLHSFLIKCFTKFPTIKESVKIDIESWVNINKPNSYNRKHLHPTCDLAGVLWIKSPKDCGNIVFDNPHEFQTYSLIESYTEEFKQSNNYHHSWFFKPIEGRLLIFPSHLIHSVNENESNEDRISVSFNIRLSDEGV